MWVRENAHHVQGFLDGFEVFTAHEPRRLMSSSAVFNASDLTCPAMIIVC